MIKKWRIDWDSFNKMAVPQSLCRGEEETLTEGEVESINLILSSMAKEAENLRMLFDMARKRFKA